MVASVPYSIIFASCYKKNYDVTEAYITNKIVLLHCYAAAIGHLGFTTPSMHLIHRARLATLAIRHFSIHSFYLGNRRSWIR